MKIKNTKTRMMRAALYIVLIVLAFLMLVPFAWMLSASFKLDKDVFIFPIQWIPTNPRWQNYVDIWTRIPLLKFVLNTVKLTLIVTFLQLLTSSFAAYAFSKLNFKGKHVLFLAYIATIAVPWQVYMVPQFMMMRSMGLADTHLAIICLQAFSLISSERTPVISVSTNPGAIAFTVIPRLPSSLAIVFVRPITPALDAA